MQNWLWAEDVLVVLFFFLIKKKGEKPRMKEEKDGLFLQKISKLHLMGIRS